MTPLAPPEAQVLAERKARFWEETDYDHAFRGTFGAYMTDVEARALDRTLPARRFPVLLDLGCGHGRFLRWLAPRADKLLGLDRSWRLLQVAGDTFARDPLPQPNALLWGSATNIPLADRSLDAITCVRVVQHVPDQDQAFREIQRVLKPDGVLILVQYNVLSPHGLVRALKNPVKALLRRALRARGREPRFDEPTQWASLGGLRRQLEGAGFVVERSTGAWLFPLQYFRSKRSNNAWGPVLALARALERLADVPPFDRLGGYLVVRCRPR